MLRRINADVTWRDCAGPLVASYAINNLVPLRAGDVVRAVAFRKRLNSPVMRLLGTIAIERVLDLLVVLLIFGLVIVVQPPVSMPEQWVEALQWVALALCGLLIALIVMLRPLDRWLRILEQRVGERGGMFAFAVAKFRHLHDALELLGSIRHCVVLLLQTALIWTIEGSVFLLVALSLQIDLPALVSWFTMATGALGTAIPSSPGHLGTFDYFVIEAQRVYGTQREVAGVFAIIVHMLLWLPITVVGGLYLVMTGGFRRSAENSTAT